MAKNRSARGNQASNGQDMSLIVQKMNAIRFAVDQYNVAVEQYKAENPDIDVESLLSKQKELLPILEVLPNRELDKFITYAKEQGTKISFQALEKGVRDAGQKDMRNGLAKILDYMEFPNPVCPECNEKMENRGRSKKKF